MMHAALCQPFRKVISRVCWVGFFVSSFFVVFIHHLLYCSDFFCKTSLFDAAFPEVRGQRDGESFFLQSFLSPFNLLKQLFKAEPGRIETSPFAGRPGRKETTLP